MPAAAIVGAAVLGAASTAYSVNKQKKAAQEQARRVAQQEQQAKLESQERAGLDAPRYEGGADIKLGRSDATASAPATSGAGNGAATSRPGSVGHSVGGLGRPSRGGLGKPIKASRSFFANPSKASLRLGL